MKIFQNKIVVGVICIVIAAILAFFFLPSISKSKSNTEKIFVVKNAVAEGTKIEESMLVEKEVGSYGNVFDGMLLTAISAETVKELIEDSTIRFDYIIIDGSEELNYPVSSIGLTMSNKIVRVYKVCAKDCVWHKAMENLTDLIHIRSKTITVINGYDKSCDKMAFLNGLDTKPDFELPFVSNCPTLPFNKGFRYYAYLDDPQLYKTEFNLLLTNDGKSILAQTDEFGKTFLDYVVEYHSVNGVRYLHKEYGIKLKWFHNEFEFRKDKGII